MCHSGAADAKGLSRSSCCAATSTASYVQTEVEAFSQFSPLSLFLSLSVLLFYFLTSDFALINHRIASPTFVRFSFLALLLNPASSYLTAGATSTNLFDSNTPPSSTRLDFPSSLNLYTGRSCRGCNIVDDAVDFFEQAIALIISAPLHGKLGCQYSQ